MSRIDSKLIKQSKALSNFRFDVAIVGNPNTGKSSVFNALTGLRQKVGNYPGVTVEKKTGILISPEGIQVYLHDLPGLYSLLPKSLDDRITIDVLMEGSRGTGIKLVVLVADACNLSRNLYLLSQISNLGLPVILALNMIDAAEAEGLQIEVEKLSRLIGIPVIPVAAPLRRGIAELRQKIFEGIHRSHPPPTGETWELNGDAREILQPVSDWLSENLQLNRTLADSQAIRLISSEEALGQWKRGVNGKTPELEGLILRAREQLTAASMSWRMLETRVRYEWINEVCRQTVRSNRNNDVRFSENLDRILTHRIAGPLIFIFLFSLVFQAIFSWAELPMNAIENGIHWLGSFVSAVMPEGVLQSLIVEGVIGGVGAILVFLPQILFLFFFLSILEDTGYMARVAFMMDRLMKGLGLSGRSIIPLLSSFACAVPGIMATRTIQNWRERLITIMIAPFMSCSARLPVYTLMIGAFIPGITIFGFMSLAGITLLAMYLLGIMAAIGVALVFKRFLMKGKAESSFVMELPPYRRPSLRWTFLQMIGRGKIFVTDAGKIILAISIVLWFLAFYPRPASPESTDPGTRIKQSYAGQIGHFIEPVIKPLGFDWKLGIGLITSFAAREVLVSTLATIHNIEKADESSVSLREALRNETDPLTGKPLYTPLVAISLMVFFVLACQCMATVAVVRRETNSWRWPILMIIYMTILAYIGSFLTYQGGKLLGLG